jgi:hypothetical protein
MSIRRNDDDRNTSCIECGSSSEFCICKVRHVLSLDKRPKPKPAPEPDWPAWAKLLTARKAEPDKGVGDTFQRLAASMGGELFKKLAKSMGLPCGCDARQADWNRLYPYI